VASPCKRKGKQPPTKLQQEYKSPLHQKKKASQEEDRVHDCLNAKDVFRAELTVLKFKSSLLLLLLLL